MPRTGRLLLELVKTRASQINGCAFCLDLHTKDARAQGETEQRLYTLSAWEETPFFTDRERATLAWTEAVTRLADTHEHCTPVRWLVGSVAERTAQTSTVPTLVVRDRNRISVVAPIGTARLGHRVGDEFSWEVPADSVCLRVEEALYKPEAAGHSHL